MFTGLIEEVGILKSFYKTSLGARMCVYAPKISPELKIGESVSINGACSTVVKFSQDSFEVEYSNHTLSLTNFEQLKTNSKLNLERSLKLSDRLDGHIVTGHIDCITPLLDIKKDGFSHQFVFKLPKEYSAHIVKKGAISINGISLTVAGCDSESFFVEIIPHTIEYTNLKELSIGENVNIETDITAKYIEKILLAKDNIKENKIDMNFLADKGFI